MSSKERVMLLAQMSAAIYASVAVGTNWNDSVCVDYAIRFAREILSQIEREEAMPREMIDE